MIAVKILLTAVVVSLCITALLTAMAFIADSRSNGKLFWFLMDKLIPLFMFITMAIWLPMVLGIVAYFTVSLW